jgi:putative endonuclease
MANRYRGTLCVGVTGAPRNRDWEHKDKRFDGFIRDHNIEILVWYEHHTTMEDAIRREKLLKKWQRPLKFRIIEEMNRDWMDLHDTIVTLATLVQPLTAPRPSPGVTDF